MLHFQEENFTQVREEAALLTRAHWDEVEAPLHGAQQYTLDHTRYETLERLGMLAVVTARHAAPHADGHAEGHTERSAEGAVVGSLAGYAVFTVLPCPHRAGVTLAALDGLYLTPEARRGLAALALLRRAERSLAARGVGLIQYSSPASRPCHALYRRLGAQLTESIWHKNIEHKEAP